MTVEMLFVMFLHTCYRHFIENDCAVIFLNLCATYLYVFMFMLGDAMQLYIVCINCMILCDLVIFCRDICEALPLRVNCSCKHEGQAAHVELCCAHQCPAFESGPTGHSNGHETQSSACHARMPDAYDGFHFDGL